MHSTSANTSEISNSTKLFKKTGYYFEDYIVGFLIAYVIICVIGLTGNTVVVITIKKCRQLHSRTFQLLFHLAISDIVFILLSPIHVHRIVKPGRWFIGLVGCKLYYFIIRGVQYPFSVMIIVAISIQRYLAVKRPMRVPKWNVSPDGIAVVLWILSIILGSPMIYISELEYDGRDSDLKLCLSSKGPNSTPLQKTYFISIEVFFYLCPIIFMICLYASLWSGLRRTRIRVWDSSMRRTHHARTTRVGKVVSGIVFSFFLCWTPYTLIEACGLIASYGTFNPFAFRTAIHFSMLAVFSSSAFNAFIYSFLSREFRDAVRTIFNKEHPRADDVLQMRRIERK